MKTPNKELLKFLRKESKMGFSDKSSKEEFIQGLIVAIVSTKVIFRPIY